MDKQQFDDAIGASPPSTVDVEAVIARQRRAARIRQFAGPGAAAVAVVVVATFGATYAFGGSGGTSTDPAGSGQNPGVDTAETRPTIPIPTQEWRDRETPPDASAPPEDDCAVELTTPPLPDPPREVAARLTAVLTDAVTARLPADANLADMPKEQYSEPHEYDGPLVFTHYYREAIDLEPTDTMDGGCGPEQEAFLTRANVVQPAGTGNIFAQVQRLGNAHHSPPECGSGSEYPGLGPGARMIDCQESTGPAGEIVVAMAGETPEGVVEHAVSVTRPDGTGIGVSAQNTASDPKLAPPAELPAPQLSLDQLVEIALDAGLTLYPAG